MTRSSLACALAITSAVLLGCRRAPPPPPAPPALSVTAASPDLPPVASAPSPPPTWVVSAIGDCTLGGDHHPKEADPFAVELLAHHGDTSWFFSGTREIFAADDLTIANLEGTLTARGEPEPAQTFHFRGEPGYARILAEGGVDVVNLANNHSHDFGDEGYAETLRSLAAAGVGAAGNGRADVRTVRGVQIVNVGFTGGVDAMKRQVDEEIRRHKTDANLVIASFHWGTEGTHRPLPLQRTLGRAAIDAGADLVLGTHPHVIQGIETYRGRHIVYSLGNFVFGGNVNPADKEAIVYQETFGERDGRLVPVASTVIPVRVTSTKERNDLRPVPLEGDERERVLARLRRYGEELEAAP